MHNYSVVFLDSNSKQKQEGMPGSAAVLNKGLRLGSESKVATEFIQQQNSFANPNDAPIVIFVGET